MTIDRFMVFAAVAKHRSATRASAELHISQPAVTKQLKLLEKNYNTKLFVRAGHGMQLTDQGRLFLRDVKTILERYKTLGQKFSAIPSNSRKPSLWVEVTARRRTCCHGCWPFSRKAIRMFS
jgi:DNA-binding transcriptional LysR family regulator